MPSLFLKLGAIVLLVLAVWGLISGEVVAGSRGFRSNVYKRKTNPVAFYFFVVFYLLIGSFVLYNSL